MENIFIPDDVFHFLATFLNPTDCMSFCLSGVSPGFTVFYSRKRIWKLSRCFCLMPNIFQQYFSKCMESSNVSVLDLSHCFWIPEDTLLEGCFSSEMKNLIELNVLDTQLSFVSVLLKVMPHCQGLTKLSVDIPEQTWRILNRKLRGFPDTYKENFKKITHLKLFLLDSGNPFIWLLLFKVLGWCRDCVHLQMELFIQFNTTLEYLDAFYNDGSAREKNWLKCKTVIELFSKWNLYDGLKWMISLKELCVLTYEPDCCCDEFCRWLLREINPPNLERLWIPFTSLSPRKFEPGPSLKCLNIGTLNKGFNFTSVNFTQLTHLSGIQVDSDLKQLPQLQFLQGKFSSCSVLDQFCASHPQLEHLHFDGIDFPITENVMSFKYQWALAHLQTLIIDHNPHPDILSKFMHSCSKLQELHVGLGLSTQIIYQQPKENHTAYRSISKQTHLRKLTLSDLRFKRGDFLQQVLEGCKKLESLHIAGAFQDCETFLKDLSKYIPLATNIRDLRIQAEDISESLLKDLISGIGSCSTLERLMIYHNGIDQHEESLIFLPDCLEDLVHRLPQLVAFCLIYPLDYVTLLDIRHLLSNLNWNSKNNGYVALRPCFWLHIGKHDLPENLSFPRIHIKEFVHPFPYIDPFPVFK